MLNKLILKTTAILLFTLFWVGLTNLPAISSLASELPGLVSKYSAEGNADDSVSGNDGVLQEGAAFAPGMAGQAFSFDGTGRVLIPNAANLNFGQNDPVTVVAWVFRSATWPVMHILGKRIGCGGTGIHYQLAFDTNGLRFDGDSGGVCGTNGACSGINPLLNVWTHVAGTFDGTIFKIYVNGQLVGSGTGMLGPANTEPLLIADSGSCNSSEQWQGLIDEVAIFNRALSAAEIQASAEAGAMPTPTPTATPTPLGCGRSQTQNATYDLAADWSDESNPNGVWSYNEGLNPLPSTSLWQNVQPAWAYCCNGITGGFGHVPAWVRVRSSSIIDHQVGDVIVHSSDSGRGENFGPANVTWTSPSAGVIDISGSAWITRTTDRSNQWTLYLNGNLLSSGQMLSGGPYNRDNQFVFSAGSGGTSALTNIPVSPGDVVKLEVNKLSTFGDFVGVNLRITLSRNLVLGNILIADGFSKTIWGIDPLSGAKTAISVAGFLGFPRGIALDSGGQIVVGDSTTDLVVRINPSTGVQTVLSSGGFDDVAGIAVEADGHILASDINFTRVYRIDPVTGAKTVLVNGGVGWNPFGITLEADGNILATVISGGTGNKIDRINSVTGARSTVSSGGLFRDLRGLTVERTGNILVVDGGARMLFRVNSITGDQTVVSSGGLFEFPSGVAVEASGSIVVADPTAKAVFRVNPVTGAQSIVSSGGGFGYPEGIVVVGGNQSPVADAGPDQTAECTSSSGITVTLNGSASCDPDGDPLTFTWTGPFGTQTGAVITVVLAPGTHTITLTVDDGKGGTASDTVTVAVSADTTPPSITCPANIAAVGNIPNSCSAALNPGVATATDSCSITTVVGARSDGHALNDSYPLGNTTITWTATDTTGNASSCQQSVTVSNPNPLVSITDPPSGAVYAVGTPVSFIGSFTDNPGGVHTGIWMFDIITQTATLVEPVGSTLGSANTTYTFTISGVYLVTLSVNDGCGGTDTANTVDGLTAMVVIYDPDGGFVTGGGWLNSPAGAYVANPSLSGKANFGFVSEYQHGATVPTGQTEFQFKVANLNFSSTVYEWLVVAGARAQYKGAGTINGSGNYGFLLTVVDGQVDGGGGADKFRIKIWDKDNNDAIVYDNKMGSSDNSNEATELGGGSIVIHQ